MLHHANFDTKGGKEAFAAYTNSKKPRQKQTLVHRESVQPACAFDSISVRRPRTVITLCWECRSTGSCSCFVLPWGSQRKL